MKHPLSWSTYACTALFLIGVFRSIYLYSVSTRDLRWSDEHPMVDDVDDDGYASSRPKAARPVAPQTEAGLSNVSSVLDDKAEGLFYFVQLSDLHLSKFQAKGHTIHFLHFLQSILPVIQPEFVVVTGDLIDGKDKTRTVSAQYVDEWKVYHTALKETVLSSDAYRRDGRPLPWYDMRGNHDCFDLDSWTADNNYYKEYGQSAKAWEEGQGVYRWEVNKPFGDYQFIAVDACPKRGPSRPFNFFGYLTTHTMDRLASLLLSNKKRYHHTFLFSHYPTTTMIPGISSNGDRFQDVVKHVSIYFCGHLHRLAGGIGDVLKTYFRRTDSLELELSDMKDHGSYRIVAVDHDLISFVDLDLPITRIPAVPHDSIVPLSAPEETLVWPAEEERLDPAPMVLITHPKDARYLLPTSQLDTQIWIDGQRHPFPAHFVGQGPQQQQQTLPLWTSVWDSNDFDDRKTHHLRIVVTAPDGQRGEHDIPFRMDATREKIRGGAGEWMMWTHISLLLRFLCIFAIYAMVLVLLIPQWINDLDPNKRNAFHVRNRVLLLLHDIQSGKNKSVYAGVQKTILSWTLRTLQFPVLQPSLWTFCFVFLLALLSLPWFYAEFIPSSHRMGYFYLWGILFKDREGDQWIPLDTWLYAIFHILFSVGVFLFVFIWKSEDPSTSHCLGSSSSNSTQENHPTTAMCDRGWVQLLLLAFCLYRLHGVSYLARYYGGGSIYPVLVWNVWVVWWGVVAGVLLLGRRGGVAWWWRGHTRIRAVVQQQPFTICPACQQDTSRRPAESFPLDPVASPTLAASSSSSSSERDEKENEHGPRMEPKARETTMTVDQEPLSIQQQDTIVSEHGMYPAAAALNRRSPAAHLSFLKNE